jgi:hypothetical protein
VKKKIGIGALIILVVCAGVWILNEFLFFNTRPVNDGGRIWQGYFFSGNKPLMSGKLFVKLPDPLPEEGEFSVTSSVYFNLWSFIPGASVEMQGTGKIIEKDTLATHVLLNLEDEGKRFGKLSFFASTPDKVSIGGSYVVSSPDGFYKDLGAFYLDLP